MNFPFAIAQKTYEVYPGGAFSTIQAAITQGIADGVGTGGVNGLIIVYPGTYTENLTLAHGFTIQGAAEANSVVTAIVGQHTWAPPAGTAALQRVNLSFLQLSNTAAGNMFATSGVGNGILTINKCTISNTGATGNIVNNTAAGVSVTLYDCMQMSHSSTDAFFDNSALGNLTLINCGVLSGVGPLINASSAGLVTIAYLKMNGALTGAAQWATLANTNMNCQFSDIRVSTANSSGLVLSGTSGVTMNFCFISVPVGSGAAINGTGVIGISNLTMQINQTISPTITMTVFNDSQQYGRFKKPCRQVNATTTLSATTDYALIVDTAGTSGDINLPAGSNGVEFLITAPTNLAGAETLTLVPNGTDVIDAAVTTAITAGSVERIIYLNGLWCKAN